MPPVSDEFEPTGAGANLQSRYGLQDELLGARGRPRRRNDEPERVSQELRGFATLLPSLSPLPTAAWRD